MGEVNRFNTREVCSYTPNYTAAFAVMMPSILTPLISLKIILLDSSKDRLLIVPKVEIVNQTIYKKKNKKKNVSLEPSSSSVGAHLSAAPSKKDLYREIPP